MSEVEKFGDTIDDVAGSVTLFETKVLGKEH